MVFVMSAFALALVADVPIGLFLESQFNWFAPFFAIAGMCVLLGIGAYISLPPPDDQLKQYRALPLHGCVAHTVNWAGDVQRVFRFVRNFSCEDR